MDAGDLIGAVTGGLGVITGVVGLVYSAKANTKSNTANTKAEAANGLAREANRLAEEANTMTRGQVERETERHDVIWGGEWAGPGRYIVTNQSTQYTAYKVHVRVTVDDEVQDGHEEQVGPGESIELSFPRAARRLVEERRELREQRERAARSTWPRASPLDNFFGYSHWIEERATWETDLGAPRVWEPKGNGLCALGELE
ncbi:hypothetical protein ACQEU8_17305 [Streptomyces sp. CA-250714]|uniref:hypothetical protein n=1 Tax=Streptomyces sp. CA-250714 TaxID=3240060 RepID=UPI003D8E588D